MNEKILIFTAWVAVGINLANFVGLILKFSPALTFGAAATLGGFSAIALMIAFFSPSTRPWLTLIFLILIMGGIVWCR